MSATATEAVVRPRVLSGGFDAKAELYVVPNESVEIWRELVADLPEVDRIAGICSGGEIGFFVLLAKTKEELILVDHLGLAVNLAAVKLTLLREHGAKACGMFNESAFDNQLTPARLSKLRTFWNKTGAIDCTREQLDKIQLVHGDLGDLCDEGPFDMLYISNAFQHVGKRRKMQEKRPGYYVAASDADRKEFIAEVDALVKPGGHVLVTTSTFKPVYEHDQKEFPQSWTLVAEKIGLDDDYRSPTFTGELGWRYQVYKKGE